MTVWGVCTVRNDGDIIGASMRHLLRQGVEHILIADGMSTDGTRVEIACVADEWPGRVTMFDDQERHHFQPKITNELARVAAAGGAAWVVPFDADEFWIASDRRPLVDVLLEQPAEVGVLTAAMWQHHDRERRELAPKPWPKVAFRPGPDARVAEGNHSVDGVPGATVDGLLEVREIQYRSFEHFCRKIRERNATIDPSLSPGHGWHHKRYADHTAEQLRDVWAEMLAVPTITDPIW